MRARARACGLALALALVLAGLTGPRSAPALGSCPNAQYRSGSSERLPDCRAYEQVSPVEKNGLDAVTLDPLQPAQSSACEPGEECTIAYMNVGAAFAGAPGNVRDNAYLATWGAGGWLTTPLSSPLPDAPASSRGGVSYAFSPNLSQAVVRVPLQQLVEGAPAGVYNLYVRQSGGAYSLITTAAPLEPPEADCANCFEKEDVPVFAGASEGFGHVIFEDNGRLLANAPGGERERIESLYESSGGVVRLVGVLPDGAIPPTGASAGGGIKATNEHGGELEHAISADGSRIVFEAEADGGEPDPQQEGVVELYDRIDGAETLELSAPAPGAQPEHCETAQHDCAAEPAQFQAASADGSLVYFTSRAALTRESFTGTHESDLYRYDLDSHRLTNVIAAADPAAGAAAASVLGVAGASEDGSYVYFVAEGALAPGATGGGPNLYVWHASGGEDAGTISFIAALAAPSAEEEANLEDEFPGSFSPYDSDILDWSSDPRLTQAYVTPDGAHLAFMSVQPLTGYDNEEPTAAGPVLDHEVFEYSAETGQLVCGSCDPSDARPLGSAFIGAGLGELASTPFHQPRSLSDDGNRLFFTSPDPLVAGVPGGADKVYEYEGATVQPISGAEAGSRAVFLDASASGDDVFFATRERLAPSDSDELLDVYDARVDGGLPWPPSGPAGCEGGACRPGSSPPAFAQPLSSSFAGLGNVTSVLPPSAKPTRRQLLARALARCRKLKAGRGRSKCIVAAERRYAPSARGKRRAAPGHRAARR
ncbi:MAG TPA: hypothetical protein VK765_02835 [Solirubrobacteraceae bacterium]|jgi:hypothetical protein|nr:hypothetical protein [Solirubrobacteraceae bacterium]